MEKPPGTRALSIVGDDVAFLFERAFAKEMIAGGRPTPRDWIDSLELLEKTLKQCSANPSHWHRNDTSCPWCPMEGATGVPLFPVIADIAASAVNIDALWLQVEALPHPGQPPAFSTPAAQSEIGLASLLASSSSPPASRHLVRHWQVFDNAFPSGATPRLWCGLFRGDPDAPGASSGSDFAVPTRVRWRLKGRSASCPCPGCPVVAAFETACVPPRIANWSIKLLRSMIVFR
jgi:hypothetical protein